MSDIKILDSGKSVRILDYNKTRPRSTSNHASLRSHESVLVRSAPPFDFASFVSQTRGSPEGHQKFHDQVKALVVRREEAARRRREGETVHDDEADGLSFATVGDLRALQQATDFDITIKVPTGNKGEMRSVTTSAFALLAGSMAVADVNMAYEGVPTVVERLVQDVDDISPHTEIGQPLDFGHANSNTPPKPLGETEEYHEANAVDEDRYTILSFKDGYQRAFSQDLIDRSAPKVFAQLSDLGAGAREILEFFALKRIIDYFGSKSSGASFFVMERNRAGAALYSSNANTPAARAPNGTRIVNNAFTDGTSLTNLRKRLASMQNARGYPIVNWPEKILIPDALWEIAFTTLHSMLVPGEFNAMNFWGPNGPGGPVELISTPMLDLLTTTAWYGGRPQRQFVRKWKQRPEIAVLGGRGTEGFLRTREGMRVRIGWDMLVGVRDYVYFVENLAGTTPPGG